MASEWPVVRLGDHVESSLGKMLDKKKNKGTKQLYLGNSDVRWGYFDLTDLSEMKFEGRESDRYGIKSGDLIICEGGEPGRCAIWKEDVSDMKIQKALHRVRPKPTLNNYYLYYWFLFSGTRGLLEPYFTGTTIKHLTGKALKDLEIQLPPLGHQEYVAKVMKSLDDKIELNRQTNKTLEQIAQAIFKSWFVDFEPVKAKIAAKQNGQDPELAAMCAISGKSEEQLNGLDAAALQQLKATAALFPDALVESELGEIPEGWTVKKVDDVVERLKPEKRYTKKQVVPHGSVPVFEQGADILLGYHNDEAGFLASPTEPLFIFGDHTCVMHLSCEPFDISQNVIPLAGDGYPSLWVYYAVKDKQEFQEYRRHWSEFVIKKVIAPKCTLSERYAEFVTDLYKGKESSVAENSVLCQIRDNLLPKLLSGKLQLDDVA
jgi:type I restriction enzyme S subunit